MTLLSFIVIGMGFYITIYICYYSILFTAYFLIKEKRDTLAKPKTKFGIMIPAHNEELFLGRLISSIKKQKYPPVLYEIIVIADNCTDNTVKIAKENGALLVERFDLKNIGKGYAIKYALENINLNAYDAVFIIDADSIVGDNVLDRLNQNILFGDRIIQCSNGVANPDESWFTRLLHVSNTISNEIYHPAKQKLGLSSFLMGNGMCFAVDVLQKYGWDAFTIGEDCEYYAKLIQAGEKVAFAKEAHADHQESTSLKQATAQRIRWSSGRFAVAWKYGMNIFISGLRERNIKKIDGSLPLIMPNPSLAMNVTLAGLILCFAIPKPTNVKFYLLWFSSLAVSQLVIFTIGIMYTQSKFKNFCSLFIAPIFLSWKFVIDLISVLGFRRDKWVRTERKQ